MAQLKNWCLGEGLDPAYAVLLKEVPPEAEVNVIEEALQTIKALGRVRVRGRMYDQQSQTLTVLCECREQVNMNVIPMDIQPKGFATPWRIFGYSEQEKGTSAQAVPVCPNVLPPDSSVLSPFQTSTPEAIIRAVGDVLQQTSKPNNSDYISNRRLRTFSGVTPTPQGEEQLESWIDQARFMIEECERPEREKR